ncbi:MAG: ATP-binding cassette domain-containing protein [Clostridiales bacterium]|nr:ATP-binding cassette domain-containing protein [Clostridiales bacterium]MDD7433293.1 ATP-binding cassette domain-containing protein [Clostridiales bacterium]MDY3062025.1 ATP-binding cassette domain-containing protein [Eubacteriales bacterium]
MTRQSELCHVNRSSAYRRKKENPYGENTYNLLIAYVKGGLIRDMEMIACKDLEYSYPVFNKEPGFLNGLKDFFHRKISYVKAIDGVNCQIGQGELIGLLGENGAGKTTLLNLIAGLYTNYQGSILIDGREIRDLSRSFLSSCMAIVPQESFIFNRSLEENIVLSESLDTNRFEKVCREARLDDLIQKLPEGNKTILGEGAQNLSGGEKQRIGIARAFYQNAPIILADEPTSSLDEENASMIFDILLKSDATVICVTHKISEAQKHKFDSVLMLQ